MIDFENLMQGLQERLKLPLPGSKAHEKMRAIPVGSKFPRFVHQQPPRLGSVLIVLYPDEDKILFPLIKRPNYEGLHSGQVSFPGGKAEAGENAIEVALREGNEEIGIDKNQVNVIGQLSDFFVIPSNFMVTPIVGFTSKRPSLVADPIEVAKILHGDIQSILPDTALLEQEILAGNIYPMKAPHFKIENEIVWGATAMMLNEFRMVLNEVT